MSGTRPRIPAPAAASLAADAAALTPAIDWRLASARLFLDSLERQGVRLSVRRAAGGPYLMLDMTRVDPCYADALRDSAARYAPELVQLLGERAVSEAGA